MYFRYLLIIAVLLAASCKTKPMVFSHKSEFYIPKTSSTTIADSVADIMVQPYRDKLQSEMSVIIGESDTIMEKGTPEGLLGNFVADLCLDRIRTNYKSDDKLIPHFCVMNNGSLRNIIPKGALTIADIYELMPFENELVVVSLGPESVSGLLNYIAENGGVPVSGIRMQIGTGTPEDVVIQNEPYNNSKIYRVLTSDYLANGGDAMNMFKDSIEMHYTGLKVRDAIIEHIIDATASKKLITSKTDGRISK